MGKVVGKVFMFKIDIFEELIEKVVEMVDVVCKGGFLVLEEVEIVNFFM